MLPTPLQFLDVSTTQDVMREFMLELPHFAKEVLISMLPIALLFFIFQLISRRYHHRQYIRMIVGLIYTYIGLVLFLTGVSIGFAPVGSLLGGELAASQYKWLLIPIGMLIGYFIVKAEPAIQEYLSLHRSGSQCGLGDDTFHHRRQHLLDYYPRLSDCPASVPLCSKNLHRYRL